MKIGVFDSGLGGLTVLKALWQRLPHDEYVYLGDTARVPYGIRSRDVIYRYAKQSLDFLMTQAIDLCVVACNTVSAYALDELGHDFATPLIGVVEPGVEAVSKGGPAGAIGIIGTEATIRSGAYEARLRDRFPDMEIMSRACPLFVPLVEEGWLSHPVTEQVIEAYIGEFRGKVEAVVLGCTHYPLLKPLIQRVLGERIRLIDSAEETAIAVEHKVNAASHHRSSHVEIGETTPRTTFFVTDQAERFDRLSSLILDKPYAPVHTVSLG